MGPKGNVLGLNGFLVSVFKFLMKTFVQGIFVFDFGVCAFFKCFRFGVKTLLKEVWLDGGWVLKRVFVFQGLGRWILRKVFLESMDIYGFF